MAYLKSNKMPEEFISIEESLTGKKPEPVDTPPAENDPVDTPHEGASTDVPQENTMRSAFEQSMKEVNPDFTIDEGFDKMDEVTRFNYMKEHMTSQPPQVDDPFIDGYLKAKEQGMTPDDYLNQRNIVENIKAMPSRDFLIFDLQRENGVTEENPNGWTTEDIEANIDKMDRVQMDLTAKERKRKILETIDSQNEDYAAKRAEIIKENSIKKNEGPIKDTIDKLFQDMSSVKDIGGIPHSKEDIDDFKKMFTDVVSLNPETGRPRTSELLNDDKVLYEMIYLYYKAHQKDGRGLKNFLSTFKEEYKQEILDKTRLSPRETGGEATTISLPSAGDYV